jgi:SAM-dependent methyltransferase
MTNDHLKGQLRLAYDRKAEERDQNQTQPWKIEERHRFLQMVREEGKQNLLEIGAGTGRDSLFFQENGLTVTCTDLSPEMVRLCRQKGLDAHLMDFTRLQFPAGSFDAVFARNCLLHLPKAEWPAVLQSIQTILKPAGLFYLGTYGGYEHEGIWEADSYEPKRFFTFFTEEVLQAILAPYFDVLYFGRIALEDNPRSLHYQSLILRSLPLLPQV